MSDQYTEMSDSDLDSIIYNSEESTDLGMSGDSSVSPMIESSEQQLTDLDSNTGVDQLDDNDEDYSEHSTTNDHTDAAGSDTEVNADEANTTDTENPEENGTNVDDKHTNVTTKFQPLRANGKEYPIDSIEELYKMASAGAGAQQKFQAIAAYKKSIVAAQRAGVNIDDAVNFMANYKENPRDAIARLMKDNNIDAFDFDADTDISVAKDYSVSDFEVKYDEVVGEIGTSPLFPKVQDVILNQWDEASKTVFLSDPEMIRNLHQEMTPFPGQEISMFEIVSPIAEKMKLSGDTRSDFEVYMVARGQKIEELNRFEAAKLAAASTPSKPDITEKKRAAAPTTGTKIGITPLDFNTMSDAELDAFLDKA